VGWLVSQVVTGLTLERQRVFPGGAVEIVYTLA
jgi:hypothetical protein